MPLKKIITWNVNSLQTLSSWFPYSDKLKYPDFNSILNSFEADIICIQEVKSTQRELDQEFHTLQDYWAFFNLHPTEGYSGVGTFVKKTLCPENCELGFSGLLKTNSSPSSTSSGPVALSGSEELIEQFGKNELLQLDSEGRCIILQFGSLILFNVYFPATSEKSSRNEFKMRFSNAVRSRVDHLIVQGYLVIVAGDLNAARQAIDRYDIKSDEELNEHLPSIWINDWVSLTMTDCFRHLYPTKKDVYTVWNTKENRRPANQGSRIDYHLISKNLIPFLQDCRILTDVRGSDHCPVELMLYDQSPSSDQKLFNYNAHVKPPPGCTSYWPSFGDKQMRLTNLFNLKRESGSFDANVPSLSARFESSGRKKPVIQSKNENGKRKVSKSKKSTTSGPIARQKDLSLFVKSSQVGN
jgi:AP endonuclease-2